jgi:hypothetical protein
VIDLLVRGYKLPEEEMAGVIAIHLALSQEE